MQSLANEFWPQLLFWLLGIATVACSVAVVVTQNVVRSAIWLLFALAATAGLFLMLGADFVAATQLLIYVGGTLVLVIFGVMLTARGPFVRMQTRSGEWTVAVIVGLTLFVILAGALLTWPDPVSRKTVPGDTAEIAQNSPLTAYVGLEFLGIPPRNVARDPANVGYLLPFEIVSVHLLVVLVGAAYLARAKKRRPSSS